MYFSRLGEFTMPIPSTAEQKKIVEILATCDRALELKQKLLEEKAPPEAMADAEAPGSQQWRKTAGL